MVTGVLFLKVGSLKIRDWENLFKKGLFPFVFRKKLKKTFKKNRFYVFMLLWCSVGLLRGQSMLNRLGSADFLVRIK